MKESAGGLGLLLLELATVLKVVEEKGSVYALVTRFLRKELCFRQQSQTGTATSAWRCFKFFNRLKVHFYSNLFRHSISSRFALGCSQIFSAVFISSIEVFSV